MAYAERKGVVLPLDCPHIGVGAGRLSACSVRLPFAGEDRSDASDAGQSRAVSVAPGASSALRLKAPPSIKTRSMCLRAQGEHSIVGLQRLRPLRGAANRRERLDGCPFNSLLRRTNVLERAPLQQRVISTGSPVGLQACYIGSVAGRPANSLQYGGKSAKVWLTAQAGGGAAGGRRGWGSICNMMRKLGGGGGCGASSCASSWPSAV